MLHKLMAFCLWLISMALTTCIIIRNGMALEGIDGYLAIGAGIVSALLGSYGAYLTFSSWEKRRGATSGIVGIIIGLLCWGVGEAGVVLNEISWRSSTIEAKAEEQGNDSIIQDSARKSFQKAQNALASLPQVRGTAAIEAEEKSALAEVVKYANGKMTLGSATRGCLDTEHPLYRKCDAVLRLRVERENAASTITERVRLEGIIGSEQKKFTGPKKEGGDIGEASRWLSVRSGHDRQSWETVATVVMLLIFALGRDAPGYVIGSHRSHKPIVVVRREPVKPEMSAIEPPVAIAVRVEEDVEDVLLRVRIRINRGASAPQISRSMGPKFLISNFVVTTPEPVRPAIPPAIPAPIAPDPQPTRATKKDGKKLDQTWPKNVTPLHQADRKPGWEARDWLRETLAGGPMSRQDVLQLAAKKGINRGAVDRASDAIPVIKIPAAKGQRGVSWGLKTKPSRKASPSEI